MSTRRRPFASTLVVLAVAMVAISACGGSSPPSGTARMPTFSPGAGAVNAGQNVTIRTTTANATIFYTLDGTQPSTSVTGTTKRYTAPITINAATTIKAVATASGLNPSLVASATYTISTVAMAATPSFNPPAGELASGTTVAISTTTRMATTTTRPTERIPERRRRRTRRRLRSRGRHDQGHRRSVRACEFRRRVSGLYPDANTARRHADVQPRGGSGSCRKHGHHQHDDGRRDDPLHDRRNSPRTVVDDVHRAHPDHGGSHDQGRRHSARV